MIFRSRSKGWAGWRVGCAGALAGATQLPAGWSYAQTAGQGEYGKNGKTGDGLNVTNTTYLAPNDSVTVTASRATPGYFTRIFGFSGITVRAVHGRRSRASSVTSRPAT